MISKCVFGVCVCVRAHLELVRLQFAFSGSGGERRHVAADGGQSFGVSVEHDGCDQAVGCAHCHTHVHHMVPEGGKSNVIPGARPLVAKRSSYAFLSFFILLFHF